MAIATAIRSGLLPGCEVAVVVSNVTGAAGIETARTAGLPVVVMEGRGREQRDHEGAISTLLRTYRVDLVCVAGYLRSLSPGFIHEWRGRTLAIHPSLLPAFPGPHAVEQALSYGARYTGCTVFFADDPEPGAILVQHIVKIESEDTTQSLNSKIIAAETLAYPEAIRCILSGGYELQGRRLLPRPAPKQPEDDTNPGNGRQLHDTEIHDGRASHAEHQPPPSAAELSEPVASA